MPDPSTDLQEQRQARRAELEATKRQIAAYQNLLEEVPAIFERKFRERLQPVLERNRQIAEEGHQLREQIARALPAAGPLGESGALAGETPTSGVAESAGQPVTDAEAEPPSSTPLMRQRLRWGLLGSMAGLGLTLLLVGSLSRRPTVQQPRGEMQGSTSVSPGANASVPPAPGTPLAADEVMIQSQGSWLEIRDNSDNLLYVGILEGQRRFPIGSGLRLNAGRPDLVTTRIGKQPAKVLGSIEDIGWRQIPATAAISNP